MKVLRPSVIVTAGPLLLGIAFAVGASVALPRYREFSSFLLALCIGAAFGVAMFGPIAGVLAIARSRPEWLDRHSWRIDFYSSFSIALSMGYLGACMRHSVSDNLMLVAFAIAFFGAIIKTALSCALREQRKDAVR